MSPAKRAEMLQAFLTEFAPDERSVAKRAFEFATIWLLDETPARPPEGAEKGADARSARV